MSFTNKGRFPLQCACALWRVCFFYYRFPSALEELDVDSNHFLVVVRNHGERDRDEQHLKHDAKTKSPHHSIQQERETTYSKSSKRERRRIQNPAREREREEVLKIQQERERTYSKSSKRERERERGSSSSHQRVVLLDVEIVYALPEETCRCFQAWRRTVEGIHKCPLCPCVFSFPLSVCAGINNVGYDDDDARDAAAHNRTRNRACR